MIKTTSHYTMAFTDEEREENLRLLKEELLKVDYAADFKEMGCDLHITHGKNYSFVFNVVKDNRLVTAINMGPLSYAKTNTKNGKESTIYIDYKKENLEEQLRTNSRLLPMEVRMELDIVRYFLKHEPFETNPLYTEQEKLIHKMNRLNEKNNDFLAELGQIHTEGNLLKILENAPFLRTPMKGEELNAAYKTGKFIEGDNYHKIMLSVKDGESNLLIREIEHKGVNGFVGAVMTHQDGLLSLQTFKPIQTLNREALREVLSIPNPLLEPAAEPVKSNVIPFEKPVEAVEELDHEIVEHDDSETEVKRKRTFKP